MNDKYIDRSALKAEGWHLQRFVSSDEVYGGAAHFEVKSLDDVPAAEIGVTAGLPCEIGDTVFCIKNYRGVKHIKEGRVSEMFFISHAPGNMSLHIVVKNVCRGIWGANIFGSREEAEAAI